MKRSSLITLLIIAILLAAVPSRGFETDQYNLPPVPLADIGVEVSEYVERDIQAAVAKVNTDIEHSLMCLETKTKGCDSAEQERHRLTELRSPEAVAKAIYDLLGAGNLITTKFGNWMRSHRFRNQPDRYKPGYGESIFKLHLTDYFTMSATVRMFGSEFGIDKLEHFFQQGYKYYKIEKEASEKSPAEQAAKKAVEWGQQTERTYFGLLISGVYSNADLYANYAGMKFFQGLTKPLEINGKTRPATLRLTGGRWSVAAGGEHLIKPFMTDHMNEALNPSAFRFTLFSSVRRAVKKHACPDWRSAYPKMTKFDISERTTSLRLWDGNDYGHTEKDRIVTIAESCFEDPAKK